MKIKLSYQSFGILLALSVAIYFCAPSKVYGQKTGGDKLKVSEQTSPEKMDNKKVKTSRRRKAKGNPNRGSNKVFVINPFKWDWDKVMWFKARKSDYETKDYNPDKRPKRKTYDNQPNYKSADRKAITNPSKLKKPLIPYDSRIAEEGPVLQKKKKPKNVNLSAGGPEEYPKSINLNDPSETLSKAPKKDKRSKVEGKKLYTRRSDKERKVFDNDKLKTAQVTDLDPKMDDDKIMFKERKDDYPKMKDDKLFSVDASNKRPKPLDNDKLMTTRVNDDKRNKFDDSKLMISEPANGERKPYDDSKLMTALHGDRERKPYDDDKLMTARPANPDRKKFDDSKLMTELHGDRERKPFDDDKLMTATVSEPKKMKLHDDRLLTVLESKKPIDEMKETSKDISKLDGEYTRHFYITNESHPGTKILAAENSKVPFLAKTFQSVSSFFTNIWTDNTQPNYVTRKKPKEKRDKKEGMIWDNSVHPDEWKKPKPESGEQQE